MEILKRVVGDLQPYLTSKKTLEIHIKKKKEKKKTLEMTKFAVLNHLNLWFKNISLSLKWQYYQHSFMSFILWSNPCLLEIIGKIYCDPHELLEPTFPITLAISFSPCSSMWIAIFLLKVVIIACLYLLMTFKHTWNLPNWMAQSWPHHATFFNIKNNPQNIIISCDFWCCPFSPSETEFFSFTHRIKVIEFFSVGKAGLLLYQN